MELSNPRDNGLPRIVQYAHIRYNDKLCRKSDSQRDLIPSALRVRSSPRFAMTIQMVLYLVSTITIAIKLFSPVKVL